MIRILALIVRMAALPLSAQVVLVLSLYLTDGLLAEILAVLFLLGSTAGILLWVARNIQVHVARFHRGENLPPPKWRNWIRDQLDRETSADQLTVVTRSMVFYNLLAGYLMLALAFALVYDALGLTPVESFMENFYFSLTTLTTVGYGDIAPLGFGKVIACVEMVAGLTYQVLAISGGMAYVSGLGKPQRAEQ